MRKDTYTADLFHDTSGVATEDATSTATFSPCGLYRYELWRRWKNDLPYCLVIGLNPSTADEITNDRTIKKLIGYCRRWNYGALCMTNLFAYCATKPPEMKRQADPVGPENDRHLLALCAGAGLILAAWGNDGRHRDRAAAVLALLPSSIRLHCLAQNKDGSPRHPLYQRNNLVPYPLPPPLPQAPRTRRQTKEKPGTARRSPG